MANANGETPIRMVPVCGLNRTGKPYLGINLEVNGDADNRVIVYPSLLEVLSKATPEQLQGLKASAEKALLWKLTHKAVRQADGSVVVMDRDSAPGKKGAPVVVGGAF